MYVRMLLPDSLFDKHNIICTKTTLFGRDADWVMNVLIFHILGTFLSKIQSTQPTTNSK